MFDASRCYFSTKKEGTYYRYNLETGVRSTVIVLKGGGYSIDDVHVNQCAFIHLNSQHLMYPTPEEAKQAAVAALSRMLTATEKHTAMLARLGKQQVAAAKARIKRISES